MSRLIRSLPAALVGVLMFAAACGQEPTSTASSTGSALRPGAAARDAYPDNCTNQTTCVGIAGVEQVYPEELNVCKKYPAGHTGPAIQVKLTAITHNVISSPTNLVYTIQPNTCLRLWWSNGGNAIPDTLRVEEVVPAGYTSTSQVATGVQVGPTFVQSPLSAPSSATVIGAITGGAGIPGTLVVFTNTPVPPPVLGSIGDFVWNDANGNGLQDNAEVGIPGVVVTLGGAGSATATTNATGYYLFPNLSAGTYTVSVALPSGYSASPADVPNDDTIDSDASGVSVVIAGNNDLTIDFGVYRPFGTSSCGYTQGYWKNHEEKWPAPYSPTAPWMQPGNLTPVTWDGLMGMSVAGGNSYMQLAHQWIAATLNRQSGAPMSASVLTVLDQSRAWLLSKTPVNGPVPNLKDSQATAWAGILDNYNNGKLGTPHCK